MCPANIERTLRCNVLVVCVIAITVAAALLFSVQPLAAKLVLPVLGGAPAVWATSMVFFQAVLLAAYGYAHVLGSQRRGVQLAVHAAVLLVSAAVLPIALPRGSEPPTQTTPVWWLLGTLALCVGPVFFALASTSPLVQRWFAQSGHVRARDPYFLSVASNFGSCVGLLAYPLMMEPLLGLREQGVVWAIGYGVAAMAIVASAVLTSRGGGASETTTVAATTPFTRSTWRERAWWLLLAFVPSSLLIGVTTHISTDIAAIPLLWVLPLLLYLVTFMLAFSPRVRVQPAAMGRALVILALLVLFVLVPKAEGSLLLMLPLHLGAFFVAAWMCHAMLAARRPDPRELTLFYFMMSLGGVLGGVFNALIAPAVFTHVIEYPLVLGIAVLIRPLASDTLGVRKRWTLAAGAALTLLAVVIMLTRNAGMIDLPPRVVVALLGGVPVLLCAGVMLYRRGEIAGLAVVTLLAASPMLLRGKSSIYRERTFFGVHEVIAIGDSHTLFHGTTAHGKQVRTNDATRRIATTYYHASGPACDVFKMMRETERDGDVAMIGMGAGTLAAYGRAGQRMTFYEIDPAVARIAQDDRLFSFLRDSQASVRVVLGDGRIMFAADEQPVDLIVLDAFSSDAIPVHLLTTEAFAMYAQRLKPEGVILVHISNRYFNLVPELAVVAREMGWACRVRRDPLVTEKQRAEGKQESSWMMLARSEADFGLLARVSMWDLVTGKLPAEAWTDDNASVLRAIGAP